MIIILDLERNGYRLNKQQKHIIIRLKKKKK